MLRQLVLAKKLKALRKEIGGLDTQQGALTKKRDELAAAIEEAGTDEELQLVEEEVTKVEGEQVELTEKKSKLEEEIAKIETELQELNSKEPTNNDRKRGVGGMRDAEMRKTIIDFVRTKGQSLKHYREEPESNLPEDVGFKVIVDPEDSGSLIFPEEIMAPVKEKREVVDLERYVRTIPVNRGSGKIPIIKKSGGRMVTVEELKQNPALEHPQFAQVSYDIDTYRGYIPISEEAVDDADYNVIGLIAEEIADQELNTKNDAIAGILKDAPAPSYTGTGELKTADPVEGLDGLKEVLNKKLKRIYNAKLFVTSSLYHELDTVKDKEGRYLLQDSITAASGKSFAGREVVVLDDDILGDDDTNLNAFIGDAREYCGLFDRKKVSLRWMDNNIYGQLLAGVVRFDTGVLDENAGFYVTYEPEKNEAGEEGGNE
ncbi:MAG TPA: phage major capsid protein [Oscillospiraceae bacterium]|nr:phage major capsid protein [Oscillospiraceae bacterium]